MRLASTSRNARRAVARLAFGFGLKAILARWGRTVRAARRMRWRADAVPGRWRLSATRSSARRSQMRSASLDASSREHLIEEGLAVQGRRQTRERRALRSRYGRAETVYHGSEPVSFSAKMLREGAHHPHHPVADERVDDLDVGALDVVERAEIERELVAAGQPAVVEDEALTGPLPDPSRQRLLCESQLPDEVPRREVGDRLDAVAASNVGRRRNRRPRPTPARRPG